MTSSRSSPQQKNMRTTALPFSPGSTCLSTFEGKSWPVVICDEHTAPPNFLRTITNPAHVPVVLLGYVIFRWVHSYSLQEFKPHQDYLTDCRSSGGENVASSHGLNNKEALRRKAFREHAMHFKDHYFWHNYIMNGLEIRKIEARQKAQHFDQRQLQLTQRVRLVQGSKRSSEFQYNFPPSKRQSLSGTASAFNMHQTTPTPRMSSSRARHDSVTNAVEILDDDNERLFMSGGLPTPLRAPKPRRRSDLPSFSDEVCESIENRSDPNRNASSAPSSGGRSDDSGKSPSLGFIDRKLEPDECKIDFPTGRPGSLIIPKATLAKCPYLANRVGEDSAVLNLTTDERSISTKLVASDIAAVLAYYRTGEIGPRLVNRPEDAPQVSRVDRLPRKKDEHAEALGKAFVTAVKMRDEDLQETIHEKLTALYPLSALGILIVARCISKLPESKTEAHEKVNQLVATHVTDFHWSLTRSHANMLQRTLEGNDALRKNVYDRLKNEPQAGKLTLDNRH